MTTKFFFTSFFLLFFISCQAPTENCTNTPSEETSTTPVATNCIPTETPAEPVFVPGPEDEPPTEAYLFDATIQFISFDALQQEKVNKAIEIIKKVIASPEFKHRVLNFSYNGKTQFVDNKGLTNAQIYQALLDGKEDLIPVVDHQMDLELELYYSSRSTVGYTYPDTVRIWMNKKFFNVYTPSEVAGNVFHEWTHKLGFSHASSYSVSRDASVPYAIGYLIEKLGKKYE